MSWDGFLNNEALRTALFRGGRIAGIILVAFLITRLIRRGAQRLDAKVANETSPMRNLQRTRTLANILSSTGMVVIWSIAGIYILISLNFNVAPLIASVGVVGLAVGFGAQSLVKDVITGFFILLEDQFGVGDVIEINQVAAGRVEHLTLRVTAMRDLDGTVHFISNGDITHVANRSKDWARAVIDVGVAYKEDPSRVREVLDEVAEAAWTDDDIRRSIYKKPEILGVEVLGEYEVTWRIIVDTKPGKQWDVERGLRERIHVAFDAHGVEIPFPHRVMISATADSE